MKSAPEMSKKTLIGTAYRIERTNRDDGKLLGVKPRDIARSHYDGRELLARCYLVLVEDAGCNLIPRRIEGCLQPINVGRIERTTLKDATYAHDSARC